MNTLPAFFGEADTERLTLCIVCHGLNFSAVSHEQGLTVESCDACGLMRTNPRLKQSAILRFYEEGARQVNAGKNPCEELLGMGDSGRLVHRFKSRDAVLRYRSISKELRVRFAGGRPDPHALEIGFGDGRFLKTLRTEGFNVSGFDVSKTCVDRLRKEGINVCYAPSIFEAGLRSSEYDLIVTWEVVEHIPDPIAFAQEVRRLLKPGGLWLIQVPNWRWHAIKLWLSQKLPVERYLSAYGVLLPIFHLYHYQHETLAAIVEPRGFRHVQSFRPRLFEETNWIQLIGHEMVYWLDALPAVLSGNKKHRNVMLVELFQNDEFSQ